MPGVVLKRRICREDQKKDRVQKNKKRPVYLEIENQAQHLRWGVGVGVRTSLGKAPSTWERLSTFPSGQRSVK